MLHQALRHDRGHDLALPPSLNPANFGGQRRDVVATGDRQGQNPDRADRRHPTSRDAPSVSARPSVLREVLRDG